MQQRGEPEQGDQARRLENTERPRERHGRQACRPQSGVGEQQRRGRQASQPSAEGKSADDAGQGVRGDRGADQHPRLARCGDLDGEEGDRDDAHPVAEVADAERAQQAAQPGIGQQGPVRGEVGHGAQPRASTVVQLKPAEQSLRLSRGF
ncbi:hypothetical protein GCM10009872_28500 [Actinopolymorpha rutila]